MNKSSNISCFTNRLLLLFGCLLISSLGFCEGNVIDVEAYFVPNATEARPNDIIFFNNTSTNADSYEWQMDGIAQTTDENFDFTFTNEGIFEVSLIAADATCQDTFKVLITISEDVLLRTGMPIWPCNSLVDDKITYFDWRSIPYREAAIPNTEFPNKGKVSAGFDNCGALAFVVFHSGSIESNNIFIFDPLGNELLGNTANGGGLNGIRGPGEIQVVKVPEFSDEWYVIYSAWSMDDLAFNHVYNPAKIRYARIRLTVNGDFEVLERDVDLVDNNGVAQVYLDGKAVSRTAGGNLDGHYLYSCRRETQQALISLDRFLINATGITFEANTGEVPCDWWVLSIAQSPIELSPREDIVAVNVRNQELNDGDVYLFDAEDFNNTNYSILNAEQLTLVADGGPQDFTSLLPTSDIISNIADNPNLSFPYLDNIGKKISEMEFSQNGRFLYLMGGGFPGSAGVTYLTYLAQVDLRTMPMEVRLQIQTVPNNTYSDEGAGCGVSVCSTPWEGLGGLETGYDGNLYFHKGGGLQTQLFVVPDPNNFLPQNLDPGQVNLETSIESNIDSDLIKWRNPDQIDGFNYLNLGYREVEVVVTRIDCADQCIEPYKLDLKVGNEFITSFDITACPDTFYVCADTTLVYDIDSPDSEIIYNNAITLGRVNYPTNEILFDFSNNESVMLEELADELFICEGETAMIFGNEISEAGLYFNEPINNAGCDTLDGIKLSFYNPPIIELSIETIPCDTEDDGSINSTINGIGPFQYQWDFEDINTANLSDVPAGLYSLNVTDGNGCVNVEVIELLAPLSIPEIDFDIQDVLCYGGNDGLVEIFDMANAFEYSLNGESFQDIPVFNNLSAGQYTLHYSNDLCDYTQSFEITEPIQSVLALPDDVTINLGESYEIESQTNITLNPPIYNWNPTTALSCDDCGDPIAAPLNTTLYALTMPDTNGCVVKDEILITVRKERNVYIPNVFSPNSDGQNDRFNIFADESVEEILIFRIFNRWGEFIFEDANFQPNDPNLGWDGTFKGEYMDPEVFTYYAEIAFIDGDVVLYKGDVTIVK